MAESSGPWSTANYSDADWKAFFSAAIRSGVIGSPSDTKLKPFADASGMVVKVPPGEAFHHGQRYVNDSTLSVAIAANTSGLARIDRTVLRRDETTTPPTISVEKIQGTPGVATPPAMTGADVASLKLGIAVIGPGWGVSGNPVQSLAAPDVTDDRDFAAMPSGIPVVLDSAHYRLNEETGNEPIGRPVYNINEGTLSMADGSGGRIYVPTARMKMGTASWTFNGAGQLVYHHNLGWSPTLFLAWPQLGTQNILVSTQSVTSTTVTLRASYPETNAPYVGTLGSGRWLAIA